MEDTFQTEKVRIKDIAEKSGVSIGTVDRVLHNRPNVSAKSRKKVEDVLKEINYRPNLYASVLASKKKYAYYCLLPDHDENAYWVEVERGLTNAVTQGTDFHLSLKICYYDQFDHCSFSKKSDEILKNNPDGVIIVPQDEAYTIEFCQKLSERKIPYTFLDNDLPELQAVTYFGQDAVQSGHFAGHLLMLSGRHTSEIMLMKLMRNGRVASHQQRLRENGFKEYMNKHFPDCHIVELQLPLKDEDDYEEELNLFFAAHPDIRHCITFSSRAYLLGEYLQRHHITDMHVLGYDMMIRNAESLKNGGIEFIIAQHPWRQGYQSIQSLSEHIILKKAVSRYHYMPLELLTAENFNYYTYYDK